MSDQTQLLVKDLKRREDCLPRSTLALQMVDGLMQVQSISMARAACVMRVALGVENTTVCL